MGFTVRSNLTRHVRAAHKDMGGYEGDGADEGEGDMSEGL